MISIKFPLPCLKATPSVPTAIYRAVDASLVGLASKKTFLPNSKFLPASLIFLFAFSSHSGNLLDAIYLSGEKLDALGVPPISALNIYLLLVYIS